MSSDIFRKKALDKISSPEQLDTIIKINSSAKWITLGAVGFIIISAIIWSFLGEIPTKVQGSGIIIDGSIITKMQSPVEGIVDDIHVKVGDTVEPGDIIATIRQDELKREVEALTEQLDYQRSKAELYNRLTVKRLNREMDFSRKSEYADEASVRQLLSEEKWLDVKIDKFAKLAKHGAISLEEFHKTEQELDRNRQELDIKRNNILDLYEKRILGLNKFIEDTFNNNREIKENELKLKHLIKKLNACSVIRSTSAGEILDIDISLDQFLAKGTNILTLARDSKNSLMQAVIYFPASSGKLIKKGMSGQVAPSTVKPQKYGYIKGIVSMIHTYPSSPSGMMNTLQNQSLVKELSSQGAPIEVRIELLPSDKTFSGFQWTSSAGPDKKILSGTLCSSYVVVKKEAPICYVMPFFRKILYGIK